MFEKIKSQFQIGKVDVQQNAFDGRAFTFELKEEKDSNSSNSKKESRSKAQNDED